MSVLAGPRACPCGSGAAYDGCCGPLLDGEPAATAQALMRSRYTAYALGRDDHLWRTWHPRTRPAGTITGADVEWLGLQVLATVAGGAGDDTGSVEFRARYRAPDGEGALHETSRFERRAGRWVYVDGDVRPARSR
jgi:SEC-C motif-containing protein